MARLHRHVLGGPRPAASPSELHARRAAMTCGEPLSMPAGGFTAPVVGFGSGKVGTPCARMHVAYSTSGGPEAGPPTSLAPAGAAVVVVPRLATPAGEPPPQAAAAIARPITAGATTSSPLRNDENTWSAVIDAGEKPCDNGTFYLHSAVGRPEVRRQGETGGTATIILRAYAECIHHVATALLRGAATRYTPVTPGRVQLRRDHMACARFSGQSGSGPSGAQGFPGSCRFGHNRDGMLGWA
jgi:hypothetical protein